MPTKTAVIDDAGYLITNAFMRGHSGGHKGGQVFDLMNLPMPLLPTKQEADGFQIDEAQLYYKGLCPDCSTTTVED